VESIFETPLPLSLPPLFTAEEVSGAVDPFDKACVLATLGCDSGVVVYNITTDVLRAAIVFAPEVPLEDAMSVLCTCGVGIQNAFGALSPPEISLYLTWQGDILVNEGLCGRLRAAASCDDPAAEPDWLVIGIELQLIPKSADDPGYTPDQTSLFQEGCGDISPLRLLESWSRHTLVWINRQADEGVQPLHAEWRGLVRGMGEDITLQFEGAELTGTFLGVDEQFGMLLRSGDVTRVIPLSSRLTKANQQ